jgi:hypothetical protein
MIHVVGIREMRIVKFLPENLNGDDHLGNIIIDGSIKLK